MIIEAVVGLLVVTSF